jgi:hypothetical protein
MFDPADIPPPGWYWAQVALRGEVSSWIVVEVTERDGRRYVDQAGSDEGCAVAVWGPRLEPPTGEAVRCLFCGTEVTPGQLIGNALANGAMPKMAEHAVTAMRLHTDETDRLRKRVATLEGEIRVRDDQLDAARQRILAYDAHFSAGTKPAICATCGRIPGEPCDVGSLCPRNAPTDGA